MLLVTKLLYRHHEYHVELNLVAVWSSRVGDMEETKSDREGNLGLSFPFLRLASNHEYSSCTRSRM